MAADWKLRTVDPELVRQFDDIGISGLANIVAAIKLAKHFEYGPNDVIMTVATDGSALYDSERQAYLARRYPGGFDEVNAGEIFGHHLEGIADDHVGTRGAKGIGAGILAVHHRPHR